MLNRLDNTQKGILYALGGYIAFVVSDTCAKWLSSRYDVADIVVWSYIAALAVGIILSPYLGGFKKTINTNNLKIHLGRGLCNLGLATTIVISFKHLPMTTIYPVLFLSPFVITILAIPIYKERVRAENWLAIFIGFIGVLVAFRPGFEALDPWLIIPFFTIFCIAGLSLLARSLNKEETILSLSFYPCLMNVIILSPYTILTFNTPYLLDIPIFILAGTMLVFGISGVSGAVRIARFSVVAPIHYLQLPLAFAIGFFLFDERPDFWMITGALIIAGSGLLLCLKHNKAESTI